MDRKRLIDAGPVPVYYCDDIGGAELIGGGMNVRVIFGEDRTLGGEDVLCPVVEIIRPLASCLKLTLRDLLQTRLILPSRGRHIIPVRRLN